MHIKQDKYKDCPILKLSIGQFFCPPPAKGELEGVT